MNYARFQNRLPWAPRSPDEPSGGAPPAAAAEGDGDEDPPEPEGEEGEEGGADTQEGESGTDTLEAAAGDDSLTGGDGDDEVEEPAARVPWQVKRLNKATAKLTQAEQRIADLEAEKAALIALHGSGGGEPPAPTPAGAGRVYTDEEFQAAVRAEAGRTSSVSQLNQQVDAIYDQAVALDSEFTARLPALREAAGEQLQGRMGFFKALTKLENAPHVMNLLTKDLDHLTDILEMDDVDLALELASMDRKVKKGPPPAPNPSRAGARARPVVPIEGATEPPVTLENAKTAEEHAAIRAKQRLARAEAKGGYV